MKFWRVEGPAADVSGPVGVSSHTSGNVYNIRWTSADGGIPPEMIAQRYDCEITMQGL